jgi:energy-coupling factor transporter ATP-binding protein EcfA2
VRLEKLELRNFRCFEHLELDLSGESVLVLGSNASGKSSLLSAVNMALQGGVVNRLDFRDLLVPIEVVATLSGIPSAAQGAFAEVTDFASSPPTLRIGIRGIWDPDELEIETIHGYPDNSWSRATRAARAHLLSMFLATRRDPDRLTRVAGRDSLLEQLISGLTLDEELEQAVAAITTAGQQLAQATPLRELLDDLSSQLGGFLANVSEHAYALGLHATDPRDVLRQLELLLTYTGPERPAREQSGGLAQGSVFALALALLDRQPETILLVDEPESALHPQAQRALVGALRGHATQSLIATHSAAVVDRVDPRVVLRLRRSGAGETEAVRANSMMAADAVRLTRYSTSLTAEAYFAETVIVVEGFSDLLVLRTAAERLGVQLDARSVSVIAMEGETLFKHYLQLLGPQGLQVSLRGLCDADAEGNWIKQLTDAGLAVTDRAGLNGLGFQVCDPDLEAELLAALSTTEVEQLLDRDGALAHYTAFRELPQNTGSPAAQLQSAFVKKDKIRWAPLLATAIALGEMPAPVTAILAGL